MQPSFIVIDLFCGAGGTTTGFAESGKALVFAAINHDPTAIESHWANHPEVRHYEEDIRTLDISPLVSQTNLMRARYPKADLILWASLECTNFSNAKGGKPRDADSRTLACHLYRYIEALKPDRIMIENLREFMSWGPLDDRGKPISKLNGIDFREWCNEVKGYGYENEWRIINSADLGSTTKRIRLYGSFHRPGAPVAWPEQTHAKDPEKHRAKGKELEPWQACGPCLDLDDHGTSIFIPGRIKSPKTFHRIESGLIKHVAGGKKQFLQLLRAVSSTWNGSMGIDEPASTITTQTALALISPEFILKWHGHKGDNVTGCTADPSEPMPTITTMNHLGVVVPEFLMASNGGSAEGKTTNVNGPANAITTQDNKALVLLHLHYSNQDGLEAVNVPCPTIPGADVLGLVCAQWLDKAYSGPENHQGIKEPAPTVVGDKIALVSANWIDRPFSSGQKHQSTDEPMGSITTVPKMNLVQVVMPTHFANSPSSLEEPMPTLTADRHWHYLITMQHGGHTSSIDAPGPTIIARQDKAPLCVVDNVTGSGTIFIYDTDLDVVKRIKYIMAMYGIVDIKMRMCKVKELLRIQGFPESYKLKGNQGDQKKAIGNSVVPLVAKKWILALDEAKQEWLLAA